MIFHSIIIPLMKIKYTYHIVRNIDRLKLKMFKKNKND